MIFFLVGVVMGGVFIWLATWEQRSHLRKLQEQHAELTRAYGQLTWRDKDVLTTVDELSY